MFGILIVDDERIVLNGIRLECRLLLSAALRRAGYDSHHDL